LTIRTYISNGECRTRDGEVVEEKAKDLRTPMWRKEGGGLSTFGGPELKGSTGDREGTPVRDIYLSCGAPQKFARILGTKEVVRR